MLRKQTRWERLLLLCQVLDQLERDYRTIYPDEKPIIDSGFEETLRDLVIPK
jgi:hypothetical protein